MNKLYVVGPERFGFSNDFYNYVLKELGFDLYHQTSIKGYYLHLLLRKYDVIWACSKARGFLTLLMKRGPLLKRKMEDTKLITRFHREVTACFREKPHVHWMPYMAIVGSDQVAWVYDCFNKIKRYIPKLHRNKFHVVHNGIDLDLYKPNSHVKREDHTIFTLSSWHSPKKRLETLIKAMKYLPKWQLHIAGAFLQNDYEHKCKTLANPHRHKIHFHGFVDDKITWMQKSNVFVMPSRQEAWSTQVMEAMACGSIVIAPRIGGMPCFVPDRELVSTEVSPEQLATKIEKLSNKGSELRCVNRESLKPYTWDNVRRKTEKVLSSL